MANNVEIFVKALEISEAILGNPTCSIPNNSEELSAKIKLIIGASYKSVKESAEEIFPPEQSSDSEAMTF